jgi:hypothetical protein
LLQAKDDKVRSNPQACVRVAPVGAWNDDDYDVLADCVMVGRIMNATAAPVGAPRL